MKIICISGKAGSGKDASAAMIKELLEGRNAERVLITHYADLLKFMCKSFFEWDGQKDERGRSMLQYIGTDVVRKRNPDFWVDFIIKVLTFFPNEWDYVIIPDCRFPNEIGRLRDAGFDVCHLDINRPNLVSCLAPEQLTHQSEIALDGTTPDYTIINDGTLDDLRNHLSDYITKISD